MKYTIRLERGYSGFEMTHLNLENITDIIAYAAMSGTSFTVEVTPEVEEANTEDKDD